MKRLNQAGYSVRVGWAGRSCIVVLFSFLLSPALPAQVEPQPKLRIVILEGEGAINNIRQRTAREPVIQVEDENHRPIAGALVVFQTPANGPGGTFADGARSLTVVTDEKGQAIARGLRPNDVAGQYQIRVTASYQGQMATATISQTNALIGPTSGGVAPRAAKGISGKVIAILVIAGAAAAGGAAAALAGGGGKSPVSISPPPPSTTITAGSARVGAP